MKRSVFIIAALASLTVASAAWALDLSQARKAGQVGEKRDGYITAIKNSPEVSALVAEVNAKREAEYRRISAENGQPVSVVSKLAAEQIINNLPAGSSYQDASGGWKKR